MSLKKYTVIILGPSGSGKTVYLASLFKKLNTQGELGFFLEVDAEEKRKQLFNIYTEIAVGEKWPAGTRMAEVSEWTFTCCAQTEKLINYPTCRFTYLDYAGGRLTGVTEEEDSAFSNKLLNADVLLGLLDGQKILSFMRREKLGLVWVVNELANMFNIMQRNTKPVHFVISKWDIVEEHYSLKEIREHLLEEIEDFKNIVQGRNKAGSTVRLIPVSSVGKGFATLENGEMKKTGTLPKPFQVEAPLACVLPDIIRAELAELMRKKQEELEKSVKIEPNLSFWDRVGQILGQGMRAIKEVLPSRDQFTDEILESLIKTVEGSAQKKQEEAQKRIEELSRKRAESLSTISDEETALNYVINCFVLITNQLDAKFPESTLR